MQIMMSLRLTILLVLLLSAGGTTAAAQAFVSSLAPDQIEEFERQPADIRKLIRTALGLTQSNLTYLYGSNNPQRGGMDCSGTVQYILQQQALGGIPRQADQMHEWVRQLTSSKLAQFAGAYEDARANHCAHYSRVLDRVVPRLAGAGQAQALGEIARDLPPGIRIEPFYELARTLSVNEARVIPLKQLGGALRIAVLFPDHRAQQRIAADHVEKGVVLAGECCAGQMDIGSLVAYLSYLMQILFAVVIARQ